ncbi:vWA domain-containing protein [Streptomyces sp. XD-27]|uniref:vWA domain-containing protein n=1 Tax=Streptomyces sp. XD-27 TaxID=3062779 RepID=UPI0026F46501|nr:vWA domain-containing protein [Streptomyces sp. XD-27]WKX72128.1 vWA domain-containing protein [Streptomyces sp. XD-27]
MTGQVPNAAGSRALLVGIPSVRKGGFDELPYVGADLAALKSALCEGPDALLAPDQVQVLESPSRGTWYRELQNAAEHAGDLLLCYFVGHGYRHALQNVLYLVTKDADLDGDLSGTALAWSDVLAAVAGAKGGQPERVVFLLDCCYSGMAAEEHGGGEAGHYILASTPRTKTQPSKAAPGGLSYFTDAVVTAMREGGAAETGGLTMHELFNRLRAQTPTWPTPNVTDEWGPRNGSGGDGPDIVVSRRTVRGAGAGSSSSSGSGESSGAGAGAGAGGGAGSGAGAGGRANASPGARPAWRPGAWRARPARWPRSWRAGSARRRRTVTAGLLGLALLAGALVHQLRTGGSSAAASCRPPLELRLLTSTENRAAVSRAVAEYTASAANRRALDADDHAPGTCRRTNITVYDAASGDIVGAFGATRTWAGAEQPGSGGCRSADGGKDARSDGDGDGGDGGSYEAPCQDPLQDVGPQPDIVSVGSSAELGRIDEQMRRSPGPASLEKLGPAGFSPLVLAVPASLEDALRAEGVGRTGSTWQELLTALRAVDRDLPLLRPDPASSETGLLHTIGLYEARDGALRGGAARDPGWAEGRVDSRHVPVADADTLVCDLATGAGGLPRLGRAAVLVSEKAVADYNLGKRPRSTCDNSKPLDDDERLLAYYPKGVPALDLPFAEVRWKGTGDSLRRAAAVRAFFTWVIGEGQDHFLDGLVRGHGGRTRGQAWADPEATGVLAEAEVAADEPDGATAARAAADYAATLDPGQVLFLVDNSGSMAEGGKLGTVDRVLHRALTALGPEDRYGIWAYPKSADEPEAVRTVVRPGTRGLDRGAALDWVESLSSARMVPKGAAVYEALEAAAHELRGAESPVIVLITDGDNRPAGDGVADEINHWHEVRERQATPDVLVVSVRPSGCDEQAQIVTGGADSFCFSGSGESVARRLADRLGAYVQGGGAR